MSAMLLSALPYSKEQKMAMYTAAGYQNAEDVRWHTGAWGRDWNRTYAPADLSRLELPPSARMDDQERETSGLKLPGAPQARPSENRLRLRSAAEEQPRSGLRIRSS